MKRVITLLLVCFLSFSLCACGECKHTFAEADCTTPKTCTACGATEGEAAGHRYADATCTAAKTCTVCARQEGEALGHAYTQGQCSACGESQQGYVALETAEWGLYSLTQDNEELESFALNFGEESSIGVSFYAPQASTNADEWNSYVDMGWEIIEIEGQKYAFMQFGTFRPMQFTENGDTVVCEVLEDTVIGSFTMVRCGADQYKVTEVSGLIIDEIITGALRVDCVFTAQKSES